jgi:uncharacterized protein (DUF1778 family)
MANKKTARKGVPRPDRFSDKTEGRLRQTLRLSPEQNQLLRAAAGAEGLSINTWAIRILVKTAKARIASTKPAPRKRVKIG